MAIITFTGVSPRSLGDLLKGYGLMALIGEEWPDTVFCWDSAGHLIVANESAPSDWDERIKDLITFRLTEWAEKIGEEFASLRGYKKKGKQKQASKLTRQANFDSFDARIAKHAWAAAIPDIPDRSGNKADTLSHPWFGAHGQDWSGDYFATLRDLARRNAAAGAANDAGLDWSLYRRSSTGIAGSKEKLLKSGGVFFPEPMKRYATGVAKWIRERKGDTPVSPWCYMLALYGALSLRGSLRRMRFARSSYPSFPFVFEGADEWEVHLPVWSEKHPRTWREFEMQIAQFQVRVRGDALASNAVEFRAAVASRGVAAGFDRFYRFVLEPRRPGPKEDQYHQQGILRGVTRVGARRAADVRLLVSPLAEHRWLSCLETKRDVQKRDLTKEKKRQADERRKARERIENSIHAAIDEATPEHALEILRALWAADQLLARQAISGKDGNGGQVPPPAPLLDAAPWERALKGLVNESAEHRIARAIGSILGSSEDGSAAGASRPDKRYIGGLLWQLLPIDALHRWDKERGASMVAWRGAAPEWDFAELLWRRWLYSIGAGMRHLAIHARRTAPVRDVVRLLNGELDVKLIHHLVPLYALLDWCGFNATDNNDHSGLPRSDEPISPVPPAYTILRSWLQLAIYPPKDESAESDGRIVHLVATLNRSQADRAVSRALYRLRIRGLPTTEDKDRPFGKSVARADVKVTAELARLLPLALLIPISSGDAKRLASRLLVASCQNNLKEVYA